MQYQPGVRMMALLTALFRDKSPAMKGGHQIGPGRQTVLGLHRKIEAHAHRAAERRARGRWAQ